MRLSWLFLLLCLPFVASLGAQGKPNSLPKDGIYMSLAEFKTKQARRVRELEFRLDPEQNLLFVLSPLKMPELEQAWGIVHQGMVFLRVVTEDGVASSTLFVRLQPFGAISALSYPIWENREVPMAIYEPRTGRLIGKRKVSNPEKVMRQALYRLEDGLLAPFELAVLRNWLSEDASLLKALDNVGQAEAQDKMPRIIGIYNDRHPVFNKD